MFENIREEATSVAPGEIGPTGAKVSSIYRPFLPSAFRSTLSSGGGALAFSVPIKR